MTISSSRAVICCPVPCIWNSSFLCTGVKSAFAPEGGRAGRAQRPPADSERTPGTHEPRSFGRRRNGNGWWSRNLKKTPHNSFIRPSHSDALNTCFSLNLEIFCFLRKMRRPDYIGHIMWKKAVRTLTTATPTFTNNIFSPPTYVRERAIHPEELSQTARAILCYFSCIITFLILPVLPEYNNFLVKHEYWNMNSAALNDWWVRNGDTYFLSALILSEEQKSFIPILLEEQQQGHENYYSNYLQVIVSRYWI